MADREQDPATVWPLRIWTVVAALAGILVGDPAQADTDAVFYQPPTEGMEVHLEDGRVMRIGKTNGFLVKYLITFKNVTTHFESFGIFLQRGWTLQSGVRYRTRHNFRRMKDEIWPLKEGKSATIRGRLFDLTDCPLKSVKCGKLIAYDDMILTVEGREYVEVPAGRFRAIVVSKTRTMRSLDREETQVSETRFWYVPELRWYVRYTFERTRAGKTRKWDTKVTKFVGR